MAKEIILYNLAPHVTDEEFKRYVDEEKGPYIDSLPSVDKYELVKITDSRSGVIPFRYVGIVHLNPVYDAGRHDAVDRPRIPVTDVEVGATDRRRLDLEEHLAPPRPGRRHVGESEAGAGGRLHDCAQRPHPTGRRRRR